MGQLNGNKVSLDIRTCEEIGGRWLYKTNECLVNSRSLPFYVGDFVSFYPIGQEKPITVHRDVFEDITTDGARFHQFYTFIVRGKGD